MKKTLLVMMLIFVCIFSACSIGTYEVTFVDYDGSIVDVRTFGNGESVTKTNAPYSRSREGFHFVEWSYENPANIQPNEEVQTDRTMYAKYKIDSQALVFQETGRTAQWYGSDVAITSYFKEGESKVVLIQDGTSLGNISQVKVAPSEGSNFTCDVLEVYDVNACPIMLNSNLANVWNVAEMPEGTYDFVIVVQAVGAGEAEIKVY